MKNKLINAAILASLGLTMTHLQADEAQTDEQNERVIQEMAAENAAGPNRIKEDYEMINDPIEAQEFVDTASAKGIAEIENARMALEDGTSAVHDFANRMIQDHTKANNELKDIAKKEGLEVSDDATLMDQIKSMMLSIRDGESFDEAYMENQITAHEQTIELFERASHSNNSAIANFASEMLPILREHLQAAENIKEKIEH